MKKYIKSVFYVCLAMSLTFMFVQCNSKKKDKDSETEVAESAEAETHFKDLVKNINSQCPIKADEITRLDSVAYHADRVYQYYYTISDKSQFDIEGWKTVGIKSIKQRYKTDPAMKEFLMYDVTVRYQYADKNGDVFFTFDITPDDYK